MAESWSVPIATGILPANINEQIAKGPDLSWIGNLPTSYFQGQDQGYQQRNRNLFQQGLPRVDPNDPSSPVDWSAASEMLAKAGGAGAVNNVIGLRQVDVQQQALNQPQPSLYDSSAQPTAQPGMPASAPPSSGTAIPNRAPLPPSPNGQPTNTTEGLTSGQINQANPGGVPQPVAQPPSFNARFNPSPQQPQQPTQVAQTAPSGGDSQPSPQEVRALQLADFFSRRAQAFGVSQQTAGAAAAARSQAEYYAKIAQGYQDARLKNSSLTDPEKNLRSGAGQASEAVNQQAKDDSTAYGKNYAAVTKLAAGASNGLDNIGVLKSLTQQPDFYSGPFHEGMETYKQFQSIFGHDPTAATPMEAFTKEINGLLREQIKDLAGSGVGRVLQAEVNIMQRGIGSLGLTPAGNRAQLEMLSRVYQQSKDLGDIADQVNEQVRSGRVPPGGYQTALNQAANKYYASHKLYTPDEIQHPQTLGAPDAPPNWPQMSAQQQRGWAAQQHIQPGPGSAVRFNGQVVGVP